MMMYIGAAGPGNWFGDGRALPLKPVWTGFAFNTALYGLTCFVVLAAVRDLARALRRRLATVTA